MGWAPGPEGQYTMVYSYRSRRFTPPNLRIETRQRRLIGSDGRATPLIRHTRKIVKAAQPSFMVFSFGNESESGSRRVQATRRPTSWGVIRPVLIRHRSMISSRASATAAFLRRAADALLAGLNTHSQRFRRMYPGW